MIDMAQGTDPSGPPRAQGTEPLRIVLQSTSCTLGDTLLLVVVLFVYYYNILLLVLQTTVCTDYSLLWAVAEQSGNQH